MALLLAVGVLLMHASTASATTRQAMRASAASATAARGMPSSAAPGRDVHEVLAMDRARAVPDPSFGMPSGCAGGGGGVVHLAVLTSSVTHQAPALEPTAATRITVTSAAHP